MVARPTEVALSPMTRFCGFAKPPAVILKFPALPPTLPTMSEVTPLRLALGPVTERVPTVPTEEPRKIKPTDSVPPV